MLKKLDLLYDGFKKTLRRLVEIKTRLQSGERARMYH
jgi:hypothetical protein